MEECESAVPTIRIPPGMSPSAWYLYRARLYFLMSSFCAVEFIGAELELEPRATSPAFFLSFLAVSLGSALAGMSMQVVKTKRLISLP